LPSTLTSRERWLGSGQTEIARSTALGATQLADVVSGVELADPDGTEFRVVQA
jgi:hypothetical protein